MSSFALSLSTNSDSATIETATGFGACSTGSKTLSVTVPPTFGGSLSITASGSSVGSRTRPCSFTRVVSGSIVSPSAMTSVLSGSTRPRASKGIESVSKETVNESTRSPRDIETTERASARLS